MDGGMGGGVSNIKGAAGKVFRTVTHIDERFWVLIDILGMILLTIGALSIMTSTTPSTTWQEFCLGLGIALIIIPSVAIAFQGHILRKEFDSFQRFDEARKEAHTVPDDLEDGYLIDYTAEPGKVAVWNEEPKEELVPPVYYK